MSNDLFLTRRGLDQMTSDREGIDLAIERGDIRLVSGRPNLAQAIVNRLLTRQGELEDLGHPDYGSRLYQLIGEPNSRRTRALAELYIREALANEPRIREIVAISFSPLVVPLEKRSTLDVAIAVLLHDQDAPLTVTVALPL
jgi:phage baseplate assembly protein W